MLDKRGVLTVDTLVFSIEIAGRQMRVSEVKTACWISNIKHISFNPHFTGNGLQAALIFLREEQFVVHYHSIPGR